MHTKQHAIVHIQLNVYIVTCPTYPDKFTRDSVVAPSVPLLIVIVRGKIIAVYRYTFNYISIGLNAAVNQNAIAGGAVHRLKNSGIGTQNHSI